MSTERKKSFINASDTFTMDTIPRAEFLFPFIYFLPLNNEEVLISHVTFSKVELNLEAKKPLNKDVNHYHNTTLNIALFWPRSGSLDKHCQY